MMDTVHAPAGSDDMKLDGQPFSVGDSMRQRLDQQTPTVAAPFEAFPSNPWTVKLENLGHHSQCNQPEVLMDILTQQPAR